ncbi:MAG TPA: ABC transporter substrate-binding protein [Actinomycetes bacterium]|nr:ABC transporter substrate-binding protein [Actinomycetes bacterium]
MRVRARAVTALATLVSLSLVLAACGDDDGGSSPTGAATGTSAPTETLKLGAILTLSGPLAQIGQSHLAGAKLAADQVNKDGGVNGVKFEIVSKDEKADPQATVQAVRDLQGDDVKLMFGLTTDSDCLAAAPLVSNAGGMLVGTSCQSNLLQGDKFVPGFFEIAPTNYMLSKATARLAADKFPEVQAWDGIGPDYEFGHEVWASFQEQLKALDPGVTFRKNVFVPLTETQFSSHISSLTAGLPADSAEKNGLFMSTFSATTVGLAKQGKSVNLFGRYKVALNLGGSTPTAEALGADTPPLWFIYDYYDGAYDNPTNTKFVADFKAANAGKVPNAWAYEGYTAVMAYRAAIEKAKSTDAKDLIDTMAGMTFDTPKGELTFRKEDHLLQSPVTVWHVQGDAASPGGFKVTEASAIPADQVLPPVPNR